MGWELSIHRDTAVRGRRHIYNFTNNDGNNTYNCCGQAAATSALAARGVIPTSSTYVRDFEKTHPPDIAFGVLGTSKQRMAGMLSSKGAYWSYVHSISALKKHVAHCRCVNVVLDLTVAGYFGEVGGHWVTVFAWNDTDVYLTNWSWNGRLEWDKFEAGWNSWVIGAVGLAGVGFSV